MPTLGLTLDCQKLSGGLRVGEKICHGSVKHTKPLCVMHGRSATEAGKRALSQAGEKHVITFVAIFGGIILLVGIVWILYRGTQHSKSEEMGRRTEVSTGPATPKRTEGRET